MHINCVICSDFFVPLSDVFVTDCGHLFHYTCLIQWIERSKSCPQCRQRTTEKSIRRIYFNVASNESEEDASFLRNQIDGLKFQLHLKDTDIKNGSEEIFKLNDKNKGLRENVKNLEGKIKTLESTVAAFRDQIRYLKAQNESAEAAIEEARNLRKHLESLKSVQAIIQGSMEETEEILLRHGDSHEAKKSLATYVSILKRELQTATEKKRELRDRLRVCQQDLSSCKIQKEKLIEERKAKSQLNKQLEDDLYNLEQEKKSLKRKIQDLEKAIISPENKSPREEALRRLILESPLPEGVKRPRLTNPSEADFSTSNIIRTLTSPDLRPEERSEPVTPYLSLKSGRIGLAPLKTSTSSNKLVSNIHKYSIFKTRRMELHSKEIPNLGEAYDGMGGHSKPDNFPTPKPRAVLASRKSRNVSKKLPSTSRSNLDKFFSLSQ